MKLTDDQINRAKAAYGVQHPAGSFRERIEAVADCVQARLAEPTQGEIEDAMVNVPAELFSGCYAATAAVISNMLARFVNIRNAAQATKVADPRRAVIEEAIGAALQPTYVTEDPRKIADRIIAALDGVQVGK